MSYSIHTHSALCGTVNNQALLDDDAARVRNFLGYESTLALDFFFFQAEDGIRDDLVTGVQTCALPIYHRRDGDVLPGQRRRLGGGSPGHLRRGQDRPGHEGGADLRLVAEGRPGPDSGLDRKSVV